jgi:hypothetical protein
MDSQETRSNSSLKRRLATDNAPELTKPNRYNGLIQQIADFGTLLSRLVSESDIVRTIKSIDILSETLARTVDRISRKFYDPPRPRNTRIDDLAAWFHRREWLMIILSGTIMVPAAFYVASLIEHVSLVEYTRLATLSWLSFLAGAILNRIRK